MRFIITPLLALPLLLIASSARAESPAPDAALAETLFQQAKVLVARGDFDEACPKLAESQRIDPGDGTLLALAACHESQGKLAAAWSEYAALANNAVAVRPDRVKRAREGLKSVEPKLVRMSIVVPESTKRTSPALEVLRDGVVLDESAWGTSIPTDAGKHVIEARAAGKRPVRIDATAAAGGKIEIVIPALVDETTAAAAAATTAATQTTHPSFTPARETNSGKPMRVTGLALGAAGLVAIGVGTYFGIRAVNLSDQAKTECGSQATTTCASAAFADAQGKNEDAKSSARISNFTIAGGAAVATTGVLLYLLAPKSPVIPFADPRGASGVVVNASF